MGKVVDPKDFVGTGSAITIYDVQAAAAQLRCDVPALRAVMDVESRNSGFDAQKRPIILFERHVFYRNLKGEERTRAVRQGLAYPAWRRNYPSTNSGNYLLLMQAIAINEEAAYCSISMGMGQVLGENHSICGCSSAVELFNQAKMGEAAQLGQMIRFIRSKRLDFSLREHNWRTFAAGYNGKGQVDKYADWLTKAHLKWTRILSKPRSELTAKDLKDAGSKIVINTDQAKVGIMTAAAAGPSAGIALEAAQGMVGPINQAVQTAQQAQSIWDWVSGNWQFLLCFALVGISLVACYFAWRAVVAAQQERVRNAQEGINVRI